MITKKAERKAALAERRYWLDVGKILGATLRSWSYYSRASFIKPNLEVNGHIADKLLSQKNTIDRLTEQLASERKK